jgi:hypothetical protein
MHWLKTTRGSWRSLSMRMNSCNIFVRYDLGLCPLLKNPESNDSSTSESATRDAYPYPSSITALTQADGLALIRSISRICPVEIKRKRPSRTQLSRPMDISLSTVTRRRSRRVSWYGLLDRRMSLNSLRMEKMSTLCLRPRYMNDPLAKKILWNASLGRPVFWV